ncbi:glycosyltransferase [Aquibacillus halophilus]|uniref:Glycosyltransferase n=1 Tax=Aquibacillus halophilus TaxID=930132 RepID=A0A6A8DDU9_9BACI|nr:glycosyltransferase family 1 protein [Aquibacillus halophilus]MRH42696.1 glycosyltransferase [Aquibacillus halophilus]
MNNKEKIKVLHVTGAMNRAGTETMLMNIFRSINRDKVQFDFISYGRGDADYDEEIRDLGGQVIKLSKPDSVKQIYKIIKKYGPYDVVHSHTLFHCGIANLAALLAGVKIRIAHAHTTLDNNNGLVRKLYINTMRLMISTFSTSLLACSNGAGSYLFGDSKLSSDKYAYFPNIIDFSKFLQIQKTEVKKFKLEQGLGNSIVIGHIGRFIEAKNHRFLLEVMKDVLKKAPTSKLLLVGDGDLRKDIEELSKQEGIYDSIRFVGLRDDVSTMLHSMDLFVFPSLYEGLGLVLLEAQASGIPCIVSEAIQPEADLNIDLVSTLTLAGGSKTWAAEIIDRVGKKEKDINKITSGFNSSGYSLLGGISRLMSIYNPNEGETYEKDVSRLL